METPGDCPGNESQVIPVLEEDPVDYGCEMQLLQDGAQLQLQLQPEEFVAIADYTATDETQLSFLRGEKIVILRQTTADWWWGERAGCCGYIPANHLGKQVEEYDPEDTWQDEEYFDSYGTLKLHLEMLADQPRTTKYHNVILQNKESLKDKVILDVGCGTGIISLFCAHHARPKAVYAVEASEMAQHTGQLVLQNGFADTITVFQQKVEDVVLPEKVDVLVSEWMGTCLLFEFMIESILYARDTWLKEDGVIWPTTAALHLVPCSAEKDYHSKVLFWDNAYEFDLSALKSLAIKEFFSKPKSNHILKPEDCLSEPCTILQLDMRTVQISDLEHHTLEADLVYDGRPSPSPHRRRGHRFRRFTKKSGVEKAHVCLSELVCLIYARSYISKSWRESLSNLEVTVKHCLGVMAMVCILWKKRHLATSCDIHKHLSHAVPFPPSRRHRPLTDKPLGSPPSVVPLVGCVYRCSSRGAYRLPAAGCQLPVFPAGSSRRFLRHTFQPVRL
ncbi:protein arginine N-methyltransferase 2 isoform X3 [Cricetulus griseus]|uniref:type I protein arginine methyltransferase n=1 Tax=Cricetulus griseus TaxID=10029 RepID=A0A9J7F484_CRIGR|nr:protein arginine N-methyltransferase 2 isoform X3 [Cricetulus griseus]XP_035307105.1 protein arginine N-methyltransferase 2 isoform X3 [Cricetulus griseus]